MRLQTACASEAAVIYESASSGGPARCGLNPKKTSICFHVSLYDARAIVDHARLLAAANDVRLPGWSVGALLLFLHPSSLSSARPLESGPRNAGLQRATIARSVPEQWSAIPILPSSSEASRGSFTSSWRWDTQYQQALENRWQSNQECPEAAGLYVRRGSLAGTSCCRLQRCGRPGRSLIPILKAANSDVQQAAVNPSKILALAALCAAVALYDYHAHRIRAFMEAPEQEQSTVPRRDASSSAGSLAKFLESLVGPVGTHVNHLPDHLLAKCFVKVPKKFRRIAIPQTCKRWHRVASSASELWVHRDVALQGKPWESGLEASQNWVRLIQWHSQRREAINSLAVKANGNGFPCLPALLACLGPDTLRSLEITLQMSAWSVLPARCLLSLHCASMAALSCFGQLKKLILRNWPGGLSYIQGESIGSLTLLEHLEIGLGKDWDQNGSWQGDGFYSDSGEEEADAAEEWGIDQVSDMTMRFSWELAKLTALHTLALRSGWPYVPGVTALTNLRRLEIHGNRIVGFRQGITDLQQLTALTLLNRSGMRYNSAIRHLAGLSSLRSLKLMDRAFPMSISSLVYLTSLEVRLGRIAQERVEEDFQAVLPRLVYLKRLHLEVMYLEMLPDSLVQMNNLTELRLERCNLPGLPRGPYLQELRILSLAGNIMQRLPAALATASRLETLDISYMERELQLGRPGKRLLYDMPQLKLVLAYAAPHVAAVAPLRLADELYKVTKMRQEEKPNAAMEVRFSKPESSTSSEDGSRSDIYSDEISDTDSDTGTASTI